jgi:hypothetical protein
VASILSQERENEYHHACVVAGRDRLPPEVINDPRVAPLLARWEVLRDRPFFDVLRIGLQ